MFLISIICLVSPWHFTAVAQNVVFPDANLAAVVRNELGLAADAAIPQASLATLETLNTGDAKEITDLTGLEHATALKSLLLSSNNISDISALSGLTSLSNLNLRANAITDISALSGLTALTKLNLGSNQISDISALSGLTALTNLVLDINAITDVSALSTLTALTNLDMDSNAITDISALSGLTNLTTALDLSFNRISSISALSGLTKLKTLNLGENQVTDISALSGLTSLTWAELSFNRISDLTPLSGLTGLLILGLCGNRYTDITPLRDLVNLLRLSLDRAAGEAYRELVTELPPSFELCGPRPKPDPVPQSDPVPELEPESEPIFKRRRSTLRCGLGWTPQAQYQPWEELYKVMIYALEFEYDPEGHQKFICKTIEIRTGDDAIKNLAGWKLYLGTLYNPSPIPITIPEEHGQITGRILRLTPEMFGLEAFPCNTVNTISHPLPGVRYDLKTDKNVLVDIAYSCFIWGQIAYTTVDGRNVESPRRLSSAALREMEVPRLERYIPNNTGVYITYMDLEAFTWDRVVLSDWLLPASAASVPGAPSSLQRKLTTTWGTLKKQ